MEERRARLVGGPADGEQRVVSAESDDSWPVEIRSTPTGVGPAGDRSYVYTLTPNPTAEGDLVYSVTEDVRVADAPRLGSRGQDAAPDG